MESLQRSFDIFYLMKHDVEAETEGHDEERVPEQEGEEGLEDLEGNGFFQLMKMHVSF